MPRLPVQEITSPVYPTLAGHTPGPPEPVFIPPPPQLQSPQSSGSGELTGAPS